MMKRFAHAMPSSNVSSSKPVSSDTSFSFQYLKSPPIPRDSALSRVHNWLLNCPDPSFMYPVDLDLPSSGVNFSASPAELSAEVSEPFKYPSYPPDELLDKNVKLLPLSSSGTTLHQRSVASISPVLALQEDSSEYIEARESALKCLQKYREENERPAPPPLRTIVPQYLRQKQKFAQSGSDLVVTSLQASPLVGSSSKAEPSRNDPSTVVESELFSSGRKSIREANTTNHTLTAAYHHFRTFLKNRSRKT